MEVTFIIQLKAYWKHVQPIVLQLSSHDSIVIDFYYSISTKSSLHLLLPGADPHRAERVQLHTLNSWKLHLTSYIMSILHPLKFLLCTTALACTALSHFDRLLNTNCV
jgi:hypothetical protein